MTRKFSIITFITPDCSIQVEIHVVEKFATQAAGFMQQGGEKNEHAKEVPSER